MAIFKINNVSFKYPDNFVMKIVDNIVNEVVTMDGGTSYDINGTKYAPITLEWAYLTPEEIDMLIQLTNSQFVLSFEDLTGMHTISAIRKSTIYNKAFRYNNGKLEFVKIGMEVMFPDVIYNNTF